jgi:molybdenum cofactor synthesis domain-containing protein
MPSYAPSAAIIIIGNEILSGKTQDLNIQFIALELGKIGVRLKEVRVVPDIEDDIIAAVNTLRVKYTYVFTTGGIGPTHDDITSETIAKAFNKKYVLNLQAKSKIEEYLLARESEIRPDHIRMAYMPESAELLLNYETGAPGFKIENVFVMAGVPYIMQPIFMEAKQFLSIGCPIISKSIEVYISEGSIAKEFSDLQNKYPNIEMGSYPFKEQGQWGTSLVLRGDKEELIDEAMIDLKKIIENALDALHKN